MWLASDENEKEVAQYTKTPKEQRKVTLATTISMRIFKKGGGGVKDTKIIKRPGRQNSNGIFSDRELLLKQ